MRETVDKGGTTTTTEMVGKDKVKRRVVEMLKDKYEGFIAAHHTLPQRWCAWLISGSSTRVLVTKPTSTCENDINTNTDENGGKVSMDTNKTIPHEARDSPYLHRTTRTSRYSGGRPTMK
ncbi:hypothetical protein S83_026233 [Arachis hypogaea]